MENKLQSTIELAVRKHANQMRKVWGITDTNMQKAALAHDLLEDTDVTPDELKSVVGETAFNYVLELTFDIDPDSEYFKREQKQAYLSSFRNKSNQAFVLKLADRFANISDFMAEKDPYAEMYKKQAKPLFDLFFEKEKELEEQFGRRLVIAIREELDLQGDWESDAIPKKMLSLFKECVNPEVVKKYTDQK